jgi:hypothetical protein
VSGRTARVFEPSRRDAPYRRAIIVGITGASFSGKTYSALRLASGFKRVLGGSIYVIDTDAERARHYEDYFEFEHVPFDPPHGPLDYVDAIDSCVNRGASIIVIDHMTHEHDGEGGVLDQIDRFMETKEAEYREKGWNFNREQFNFTAQIVPKRQRKKLNQRIVQLGKQVVFILCYQAQEKIRPRKKGEKDKDGKPIREPEDMGWQPITTSTLPRDMTVRFLLTPACEGVPVLLPPNPEEKKLIKQPEQFKGWFREGEPLSEDMGERLANWAIAKKALGALTPADYDACTDRAAFDALEKRRADAWKSMPPSAAKNALKAAADAAKSRLTAGADAATKNVQADLVSDQRQPYTADSAITALRACEDDATRANVWKDVQRDFEAAGTEVPLDVEAANQETKERFAL